jgi:mannose-1-phosphate guanylyltransferase
MHTSTATTKGATPMTTRDTRTAEQAYMENHTAAVALVERIRDALAVQLDPTWRDGRSWGHVGDIAHTRSQLQEISDRLFNEGEHAD